MGLASLYTILSKKYDVQIIDFDFLCYKKEFIYKKNMEEDIEQIVEHLILLNPKVYSFYTISNSYPVTILIAQKISQRMKNAKIVFGGPHATMTAFDSLTYFSFITAIGMGEGELYIEDMMNAVISGKDLSEIAGVAYRDGKKVIMNKMPRMLTAEELNKISFLNFKARNIYDEETSVIAIEAGRGCPCRCSFCSTSLFWKKNFRLRDIAVIISEIEQLQKECGVKHIDLQHDHFTANRKSLNQFCEILISKKLGVTWGCSSRIDNLNYKSIDLMKASGCKSIFVGFETGSERMQREIHKNLKIEDAVEKIIYIKNLGIGITVSFIFGFPQETVEDFLDTVHIIERLYQAGIQGIQLHRYMPLPMTEELQKVKEQLYLDNTDIDISIYNESICTDKIYNMIQQYPKVFTQFYTFHSVLRQKYKHFDFFINFLSSLAKNAPYTVMELAKLYGLEQLYLNWETEIQEAYIKMNSGNVEDFFTYKHIPEVFKKLYNTIIDATTRHSCEYYKNIAKFESLIINMNFKEDIIYEFDYDVLGITKGKANFKQQLCRIIFIRRGDQIKITKLKEV